jgi:hypothetical protein
MSDPGNLLSLLISAASGRPPAPLPDIAQQLTDAVDAWTRAFRDAVEGVGRESIKVVRRLEDLDAALPTNWRNLTYPQIFDVMDLMRDTGWSLLWTPPAEVLAELLEAPDRAGRGAILVRREALILHELDRLADRVTHPRLGELRDAIAEAIEVYRSGSFAAAQALATVTLTTAVHTIYGGRLGAIKKQFRAANPLADGLTELRLSALKRAVAMTLADYSPGDHIPSDYNRHASTHGAGLIQYTQLNSLTSLMLVVSLLVESQTVPAPGSRGGTSPRQSDPQA